MRVSDRWVGLPTIDVRMSERDLSHESVSDQIAWKSTMQVPSIQKNKRMNE